MATVRVTEQKVILCGEYGVGKTSIFRRFANNTFVASSDRKSTLGLDNIDKEYVVEDRRIRVSSAPFRSLWGLSRCPATLNKMAL